MDLFYFLADISTKNLLFQEMSPSASCQVFAQYEKFGRGINCWFFFLQVLIVEMKF